MTHSPELPAGYNTMGGESHGILEPQIRTHVDGNRASTAFAETTSSCTHETRPLRQAT